MFIILTTPARVLIALAILACFAVAIVSTLLGDLPKLAGSIAVAAAIAWWRGLIRAR